jgi:predicted kinase
MDFSYVLVSGPPGSGKSTVAGALAERLDLPLLAKDVIKESLMDTIDVPDLETSRSLGRAAVEIVLAPARSKWLRRTGEQLAGKRLR